MLKSETRVIVSHRPGFPCRMIITITAVGVWGWERVKVAMRRPREEGAWTRLRGDFSPMIRANPVPWVRGGRVLYPEEGVGGCPGMVQISVVCVCVWMRVATGGGRDGDRLAISLREPG